MTFDLILEGKAYVNQSFQPCCIGIEEGVITAIKKVLTGGKKKHFSKEIILPSGVDIHVHFRDPGFLKKETFATGSTAAAYGGTTCVFDMPNTKPQTISLTSIKEKRREAEKTSLIDFGLYASICDQNIDTFLQLQSFVQGFKVYLGSTTNALQLSDSNISQLFSKKNAISKPVLFHAEDNHCLEQYKGPEHSLYDHHKRRPASCEVQAIKKIIKHVPVPFPIHICHISSNESLEILLESKEPISIGVTPHHSLLNIEQGTMKNATWFKVNPPLRTRDQQISLYNAIKQGNISIIESDHAPHTRKEKENDFQQAPSGISGVETRYPLFLYLAWKQEISFERLLYSICEKPAALLKVKKGSIALGNDADVVIIDFKKQEQIKAELLHSKTDFSPFENMPAIFPQDVFLRGEQIIEDRQLIVKNGFGTAVT